MGFYSPLSPSLGARVRAVAAESDDADVAGREGQPLQAQCSSCCALATTHPPPSPLPPAQTTDPTHSVFVPPHAFCVQAVAADSDGLGGEAAGAVQQLVRSRLLHFSVGGLLDAALPPHPTPGTEGAGQLPGVGGPVALALTPAGWLQVCVRHTRTTAACARACRAVLLFLPCHTLSRPCSPRRPPVL
jgi:hypothetical protein